MLIGGLSLVPASANTAVAAGTPNQVQIHITPVETNLSLAPGQVYDGTFQVGNTGDEPLDFYVAANRFYVKDVTYETTFDEQSAFTQVAEWITFDETSFHGLEPGGRQEIAYHITVPKDAPGGGQYAVLFAVVSDETTNESISVRTNVRAGMKIYAKISGATRAAGQVESVDQSKFFGQGPIKSTARVKNTGNVDFTSTHQYIVKSLFGDREIFNGSATVRVMPDTVREAAMEWKETPIFGIFRVENKVSFLGQTQYSQEKTVIVAPWWLIVIAGAALFLVLGLIFLAVLRLVKRIRHQKVTKQRKRKLREKKS
jgi:hypothetical protein